ncbi:MAG TPA: hypothetical protein VL832_28320 [Puia sp.]|nr:hypothetical protein [Puia sp.]
MALKQDKARKQRVKAPLKPGEGAITQWDILEFSKGPDHESPQWPEGYWPKEAAPPHAHSWKETLDQITNDRKEFIKLLHEAGENIYTPAHEEGVGELGVGLRRKMSRRGQPLVFLH